MKVPDEKTITAWARLVRAHGAAFSGVEARLKENGLPSLSWYDALLELRKARGGLRLQELEARLLLPQYNISRLADRLEDAGFAQREADPNDGRGRVLKITREGRALLKRMWPVYANAIEEFIGGKLTARDASQLSALLSKIIDA